jgi:transcription termination factor Rho
VDYEKIPVRYPVEAMSFINDRFKQTKNNEEFLISMND